MLSALFMLLVSAILGAGNAFPVVTKNPLSLGHQNRPCFGQSIRDRCRLHSDTVGASTIGDGTVTVYESLFNFTNPMEKAVDKFERIDDAVGTLATELWSFVVQSLLFALVCSFSVESQVMGGISLSSVRQLDGEEFARWSGVCRVDGG